MVVTETALPASSTTEKCVVEGFSFSGIGSEPLGVERSGSMDAASRRSLAGSVRSDCRT